MALPGVAMEQTDVRTLLSCMRGPPRCGVHNSPPRAALTARCMPARRSAPKPPRTTEPHAALAALGFRVAASGPHTSKTLILQELETLLAAVPADAPAKFYRAAIVEENVLGKGTLSIRKETGPRLTGLHGFDPTKPLFRVRRRHWGVAATNSIALASNSQLVGGCSCAWDLPLASAVTTSSEEEE